MKLLNPFDFLDYIRWQAKYNGYRKKYEIAQDFRFNGSEIEFYGYGRIIIGSGSYIGSHSSIQSVKGCKVQIGRDCAISHYVNIYTQNYQASQDFSRSRHINKGDVVIGDNCWIGMRVFIREGIDIGNNVIVGANSVVTKSFESHQVIAGCPAKPIHPPLTFPGQRQTN